MTIRLFHGTNSRSLEQIIADGHLKGPVYLTDSLEVANYFAKWQRRNHKEPCVILEVTVDENLLDVDEQSLLDPIPFVRKKLGITDTYAHTVEMARYGKNWLDRLAKKYGEESLTRWAISLALANAVCYQGNINLTHVVEINAASNGTQSN